ncbi:MAG: transposase [Planctomycetaceae bacterium]|nr:transposase [Planctomycetaceae bacterium]
MGKGNDDTNLTDRQSAIIRKVLPARSRRGRRPIDPGRFLNAIFNLLRIGCQWRLFQNEFPRGKPVNGICWMSLKSGLWQRIRDTLRGWPSKAAGKTWQPTADPIDSQSIRTTEESDEKGSDAVEKVSSRKRHTVVHTCGDLLAVAVHSARRQDEDGTCFALIKFDQWSIR